MKQTRNPWPMTLLSIGAWGIIVCETIFWNTLMALVFLVHPLLDPHRKIIHSLAGMWGRGLIRLAPGCRVHVTGRENIPRQVPVVFMANHQSYVDIPALYFLRTQFKWIANEGLFSIPFLGWGMGLAGYVPVRRSDARQALRSLEKAREWLRNGVSVLVFPEGTRSHTGIFGQFHSGGFRLAVKAGVPIVPVVVIGTRQLLPRNGWVFRWGLQLQIRILPPLHVLNSDKSQLQEKTSELRGRMRAAYREGIEVLHSQRNGASVGRTC